MYFQYPQKSVAVEITRPNAGAVTSSLLIHTSIVAVPKVPQALSVLCNSIPAICIVKTLKSKAQQKTQTSRA